MKNKKLTRITALAVASGLVIAGGAGTLGLTMAKAQQETITKEVYSEVESMESDTEIGEGAIPQESQPDVEINYSQEVNDKTSEEMDSQEKANKDLKERKATQSDGESDEAGFEKDDAGKKRQMSWKNFNITFYEEGTEQKDGDLEITEALEKAVEYVKKEEGISITGGRVEIQLMDDAEINEIMMEYDNTEIEEGANCQVSGSEPKNKEFSRNYVIIFDLGKKGEANVTMNAVTGEIYNCVTYSLTDEVPMDEK